MFVHVWRMRARKKRVQDYEKFGLQVTLPSLRRLEGCLDAFFLKVSESRKPQYLWVVFWKDQKALEAAHSHPVWREQIRKFELGKFYKTPPLELICEALGSLRPQGASKVTPISPKGTKPRAARKRAPIRKAAEASEAAPSEPAEGPVVEAGPTPENE
ncbi:MAG TPA: antibiotic biosynthesis monooxygenase [Terriglobia bacterium]|nr:antibiotic biosynthesis monooxygenase [Terriglobia bacterium]